MYQEKTEAIRIVPKYYNRKDLAMQWTGLRGSKEDKCMNLQNTKKETKSYIRTE